MSHPNLKVLVCSQDDLRKAQYALYLAAENSADAATKAALTRIEEALHDITNHTNFDVIGSDAIIGERGA